ncbi:YfbK domain-containing protein [Desertivirga xinjiangensis]|uniref:YfbK domain-containing protein n=1 Tax=Desertivirga xinjiangensis TaxID=539206 RepID=UPI0021098F6A|nr:von Willebrand factor type A domain-containing protein [Pedobacter xinjiangensis]
MRTTFHIIQALLMIFFVPAQTPAMAQTIRGIITDNSNNQPLSAVDIRVKNSSKVTSSDSQGLYKVTLDKANRTLVFSYPGYQQKEVTVGTETIVNVKLSVKIRAFEDKEVQTTQLLSGKLAGVAMVKSRRHYIHPPVPDFNTESYNSITENGFKNVSRNPLSTFSIDVDVASYSTVRRFVNSGQLPPVDAVRIEEMLNYFNYTYPEPKKDIPLSMDTEISEAPWNNSHRLVKIGLQGRKMDTRSIPPSNLVFLIDVSGSMNQPNKLPLLKSSLKLLVNQLREDDKVSIVVYAGAAGLVLPPTSGNRKQTIKNALDQLEAGGSTAGGAGIKLAYAIAAENFLKAGNNRVILATDGDFNIGTSSDSEMQRMIEEKRESGIFLTVLGFGMGNYKDSKMEILADKGNGNYAYVDNIAEARKVLVSQFGGTLHTVAKDVKLQVEFNPGKVQAFRLIGYENRLLNNEDFNNDEKDAGDLGSGHTVTALYEIIPVGIKSKFIGFSDVLKYQKPSVTRLALGDELLTVKIRYKTATGNSSKHFEKPVIDTSTPWKSTSNDFRFAASVAAYGMILRNSEFKQNATFKEVIEWAKAAVGQDEEGYRKEFLNLVKSSSLLSDELLTSKN